MIEHRPPPRDTVRAGYELRDLSIPLIITSALVIALAGLIVAIALWQVLLFVVPEQQEEGASPPTVMPGEEPVNDRVRAIPPPRLDPLEPLEAQPADYRSSRPLPKPLSPTQRPEDLRADRQPTLQSHSWVEKGKVAQIPIDRAMDAVIEMQKSKSVKKEGGK